MKAKAKAPKVKSKVKSIRAHDHVQAVVHPSVIKFKPKSRVKKGKIMEDKEKEKEQHGKPDHDKPEHDPKSSAGGSKTSSGKGNGEGAGSGAKGSAASGGQGGGEGDEPEPSGAIVDFVTSYVQAVNPPAPAPGEGGGDGDSEGSDGDDKSGGKAAKGGGSGSQKDAQGAKGGNGNGHEQSEADKKKKEMQDIAKQIQQILEQAKEKAGGGKKPGMVPYAVDKWPPPDEQEAAQHFFAGDCYKAKERAEEEQRYKKQLQQLRAAYEAAGQVGPGKGSPEEAGAASMQGFPSGATPDTRQQQASKENAGSEQKGPGGQGFIGRTSPSGGGGGGQQHSGR